MEENLNYRQCSRCVMDTTDIDITFDENGYCNHCTDYFKIIDKYTYKGEESDKELNQLIEKIKLSGKNKKYDCIVGVSGGVDSSYVAYLTKKLGLRVLAVHMDNGWDTLDSIKNIKTVVDKLKIDYESHVLNWDEFREIQLAFLRASVPEVETPTDMAMLDVVHNVASKYGVKYVISGGNYSSEGILPKIWQYNAKDMKYFNFIVKNFSNTKIKTFPTFGFKKEIYYKFVKGIKIIYILNYVPYSKDEAKKTLQNELNWTDYGGKHHESKITAFVQSYLMPKKFNFDYRKATYSSMICNNQMTRNEAIELLKQNPFNAEKINDDINYIAKKFAISKEELEKYINLPPKTYRDYPNDEKLLNKIYNIYRKLFPKKSIEKKNNYNFSNCLICNSGKLIPLKGYETNFLTKCGNCGFVFSTKKPTNNELINHYNKYHRNDYLSPITIKRYNQLLDNFEKYRKTNKILDIGCGIGYFLDEAKNRGWEVYGNEITDKAIQICENKGLRMYKGRLSEIDFNNTEFDVITSLEVIEHINNPLTDVKIINSILRVGGVFYFTTPNFNAIERFVLKNNYSIISYPEHLSYYTARTINNLLVKNNFKKIWIKTTGFSFSRIKKHYHRNYTQVIAPTTTDEQIRAKIEDSKSLKIITNLVNSILTFFKIGNSLKGLYKKN